MGAEINARFCRPIGDPGRRAQRRGHFSQRSGASVPLDATFDFIGVSSYGNRPSPAQELQAGWDSTGEVRLTKDMDQSMIGPQRDSGRRHSRYRTHAELPVEDGAWRTSPSRSRIAALLDKPSRRKQPIQADYIGFTIPDEFVVGYGLDYAEKYRNLPDICMVPRETPEKFAACRLPFSGTVDFQVTIHQLPGCYH